MLNTVIVRLLTATQWPQEHSMRYRSVEDQEMLSPA